MNMHTQKMVLDLLEGFPEQKISSLMDYIEFLKEHALDAGREGADQHPDRRIRVPEAGP